MILVCAMSSLSLRERVSAEQKGEGLAFNAMGSSPSSGRSATTFSRTGEGRWEGMSLYASMFMTTWEVKR